MFNRRSLLKYATGLLAGVPFIAHIKYTNFNKNKLIELAEMLAESFRKNDNLKDLSRRLYVYYIDDPCLYKSKRIGWYGYTTLDETDYASSIDISLEHVYSYIPKVFPYEQCMEEANSIFNAAFEAHCKKLNIRPISLSRRT